MSAIPAARTRMAGGLSALGFLLAGVITVMIPTFTVVGLVALLAVLVGVRAHRRLTRPVAITRRGVDDRVIPEILLLPLAIGLSAMSATLSLLIVLSLACLAVLNRPEGSFSCPLLLLAAASGVVWAFNGVHLLPTVICLCTMVVATRAYVRRSALGSLIDGIGLYLIANVVGYFLLDLRSSVEQYRLESTLESSTTLFSSRIVFPFTQSLVTPPALAAAFIVGVLPLMLLTRQHLHFRRIAFVCATMVLIGANSRTAILAVLVILPLIALRPGWLIRSTVVVSLLALVLPFGYSAIRATGGRALATAVAAAPLLGRAGERNVGTLSGREEVWTETLAAFRGLPARRQALGYGPNGHIVSGISRHYASRFKGGFVAPLTAGSHSTSLQQLVDGGWIGLALLLGAIGSVAHRLSKQADDAMSSLAGTGLVVTLAVLGATESVLAPGTGSLGFFVLLLLAGVAQSGADASSDVKSSREVKRRLGVAGEPAHESAAVSP